MLEAIARYLELNDNWFEPYFKSSTSTFRPMRYPPKDSGPSAHTDDTDLICEAHVDSGFMTILYQDNVGGLQVKNPYARNDSDRLWLDVPPRPDSFVVNIGKAMQRWSNDHFVATEHRVVGQGRERFSAPFFFEPALDTPLTPIPSTHIDKTPHYPPCKYQEHLLDNMRNFIEYRGLFEEMEA